MISRATMFAEQSMEFPIDVAVQTATPQATFSWAGQPAGTVVKVYRRSMGATGTASWALRGSATQPVTSYTDTGLSAGGSYEYKVERNETGVTNYTAFTAVTVNAPLVDSRGAVLLVVDSTVSAELAGALTQYELDLVGDGWEVVRLDSPRHGSGTPEALKAAIVSAVAAKPAISSVILFGKLPMVRSGMLAPDGHTPNRAHETDTFYADLNGSWTDNAINVAAAGSDENENIPGDGKYDQSYYPTALEVAVGRVTFHDMPSFRKTEVEYLRDYLHKNHAWRQGRRSVQQRAYVSDGTPAGYYLFNSVNWLSAMLGSAAVESGALQPATSLGTYLWAISCDDLGPICGSPEQAIFMESFKSYKQHWWRQDNAIRGMMTQPDWGLTSVWGARPQWYFQHMAAGQTYGYSCLRTQNNGFNGTEYGPPDYSGMEKYVSNNIHGDPTLRLHPVLPPGPVTVSRGSGTASLAWAASAAPALAGYHVYRSATRLGGYTRLTTTPITGTAYTDGAAPAGALYYQVRAVATTTAPTGTYLNQSQASFGLLRATGAGNTAPVAAAMSLTAKSNSPSLLDLRGTDADGDLLTPVVLTNPAHGQLRWYGNRAFYVSAPGYTGSDSVTFVMSDGVTVSAPAVAAITVDAVGTTLLAWEFADGGTVVPTGSTYNAAHVQPSNIANGAGVGLGQPWPSIDQYLVRFSEGAALGSTDWLGWTIAPEPGYRLSLSRTTFGLFAQPGITLHSELRASTDGFATYVTVPIQGGTGVVDTAIVTADLSGIPALQSAAVPVAFRLHVWHNGLSTNYVGFGHLTDASAVTDAIEDLAVFGTLSSDGVPTVAITAGDASANEAGDPATFTVSRTPLPSTPVTIGYTVGGTATAGDFAALSGTLTLGAGETSATITLQPIDDGVLEPDETVVVTLAAGTDYLVGTPGSATATIADDEPNLVTVSATDATAGEPGAVGGNGTFRLTRAGGLGAPLTVALGVGGTAGGGDYGGVGTTAVFAAGVATVDLTLSPVDDAVAEASETVDLAVLAGPGYAVGSPSTATVTIKDDEAAVVAVAVNDADCQEASSNNGTFTLTRLGNSGAAITVNITLGGQAANGTDYVAVAGTVSLAANANVATVTIDPTDDAVVESTETVTLTVAAGSGYAVGTPATASLDLLDNDKPTVSVVATDGQADESGATATFTVSRNGAAGDPAVTVAYAVTGSGLPGIDYQALSGTVTIPSGQTSATVAVTPLQDATTEFAETVIVTLTAQAAYTVAASPANAATAAIVDDTEAPFLIISASDSAASEPVKGDGGGMFTISRAGSPAAALSVSLAISGTATQGADVNPVATTASLASGATSTTVAVTALDDAVAEPDETVIATLLAGSGYTVGATAAATVNIYDDEPVQVIAATTDALASEAATAGTGNLILRRLGLRTAALTVPYTLSGAAVNGTDYVALSGTATLAANTGSLTLTLTPINDAVVEGTEFATLTVGSGAGYALGSPSSVSVEIVDDELVDVTVSTPDAVCGEPADGGSFRLTRSVVSASALTVNYTIGGTATAGADYTVLAGTATIAANATTVDIVVAPLDDALVEGSESVVLTLALNGAGYDLGTTRSATLWLRDDEVPTVTLATTDAGASEVADGGLFTLTCTPAPAANLIVTYTVGGTALNGTDYAAITGSAVIPSGATTATIAIAPVDDQVGEGAETVIITLASGAGYSIGTTAASTVTIAANDQPVVSLVASDAAAAEAGVNTGAFAVLMSNPASGTTAVAYTVAGTATATADYTALTGTVSISSGGISGAITVTPVDDAAYEGGETVVATLSASASYAIGTASATVDIVDNDAPGSQGLTVSGTTVAVGEGGTATVTVRLQSAPPVDTIVTVVRTSGDGDLSVASGASLTFTPANWDAPQSVTLSAAEDADAANGSAIVTAASAGMASVNITATETDNEAQSLVATPTVLGVAEGASAQVAVSLAYQPGADVIVTATRSAGDAAITVAVGASLTFTTANWATPQAVTVAAAEDVDVTPETATVSIASTGLAGIPVAVTASDNDTQSIVLSAADVFVREDATATCTVRLAYQPAADTPVTVAFTAGDADIRVVGGSSLVFTPVDWATPQTVTLAATADADATAGTATITASAAGLAGVVLTAHESENTAPVIAQAGPLAVTLSEDGAPTAWSAPAISASDAEGDVLTWSLASPAAHGVASVTGTGANPMVGYVPAADFAGADSFTVRVSDGALDSTIVVAVTVAPVNDAPVLAAAVPDQRATVGVPFSFRIPAATFTDVDGDAVSLSASRADGSALPAWLAFSSGAFSGTALTSDIGFLAVRVTAEDGQGGSAQAVFSVGVAPSTDYTVTTLADSGAGSLRQAMTTAMAAGAGRSIGFAVDGTVLLASALPAITQSLVVDGRGRNLVIDGANQHRPFSCSTALVNLTLRALTIDHGRFAATGAAAQGGGISWSQTGSLTLDAVTVRNCTAIATNSGTTALNVRGGGVYAERGSVILNDSVVANCTAQVVATAGVANQLSGGGICIADAATLAMTRSVVRDNAIINDQTTVASRHGLGGGVCLLATLAPSTMTDSTVSGNTSPLFGGGIGYAASGTAAGSAKLTLTRCTIDGNHARSAGASVAGGGIHATTGTARFADLILYACTIANNDAVSQTSGTGTALGGGISLTNSDTKAKAVVSVYNSTISGNVATAFTAASGNGGGVHLPSRTGISARFDSTILAGNGMSATASVSNGADLVKGTKAIITSASYVLLGSTAGGSGIAAGVNGCLVGAPLLGALGDNGGPTRTMVPGAGSPARDAGSTTGAQAAGFDIGTDQRGVGFGRVVDLSADIGAVEALPTGNG